MHIEPRQLTRSESQWLKVFGLWLLALWSVVVPAAASVSARDRAADFAELTQLLSGRYSGVVADPTDPTAQRSISLYHKIARLDWPTLGEYVYYHQISLDSFDSKQPWQQKIYVFDQNPARKQDTMRAFVIPPTLGLANLESDPVKLSRLVKGGSAEAAGLQGFQAGCEIRWSRAAEGTFTARVRKQDCRYDSAAFKQKISPEISYRLSSESFGFEEILYGAQGKPLLPASGMITLARQASTAAAVLAASKPTEWRRLDPERTLYMDLDAGRVIFELSAVFAPQHVANLRALVRAGWFEGLSINRVQDNFVTQWGDPDGKKTIVGAAARIPPEFEREWTTDIKFDSLTDGDTFAPQVGFVDGFWAAGDRDAGRLWMTHCYGTLGVGRDTAADSGSGAELYVVIGHAPRQLDRNITVLGRAVSGMELLAALPRGTQALGFYATAAERTPIRRVVFAADLPPTERVELELLRTDSASFAALVEARRNRRDDWYKVPAGKIDLCSTPLPVRRKAMP
ncbi:MAG: peptidylprolyl isomerase [Gammaproteobacteria bacterium]|jgi:peptidylprolyl isomerase